jgi:hypothetical protein
LVSFLELEKYFINKIFNVTENHNISQGHVFSLKKIIHIVARRF